MNGEVSDRFIPFRPGGISGLLSATQLFLARLYGFHLFIEPLLFFGGKFRQIDLGVRPVPPFLSEIFLQIRALERIVVGCVIGVPGLRAEGP